MATVQTMKTPLRILIGYDSRERAAYDVCVQSLLDHASVPLAIEPLDERRLRHAGLYRREWTYEDGQYYDTRDRKPFSTWFSFTRFLTPSICQWRGVALFCDCDFLWLGDIAGLAAYAKGPKAVFCVQHDYRPTEKTKMDGAVQTVYPRKNWSSLMLFNCDHPAVRSLTLDVVNRESGAYLHRMQWVADADIGELPVEWNWLEGWNEKPASGTPNAVHFTRGGPWFEQWQNVDYGDLWRAERDEMLRAKKA